MHGGPKPATPRLIPVWDAPPTLRLGGYSQAVNPVPPPPSAAGERVVDAAWAPLGFPCHDCASRLDEVGAWCAECRRQRKATNMRLARWHDRYGTTFPPLHPRPASTEALLDLLADPGRRIRAGDVTDALAGCELAEMACIRALIAAGVLRPRTT